MVKTTTPYWNPLRVENADQWSAIADTNGMIEQITLAVDEKTGDYTRLTRFKAGADTTAIGPQVHHYPEEIFIVSGQLYDQAFDRWLEPGDYASRPPGEVHGPFQAKTDCIVLECSYPNAAST
ncbi:cupin domain-containing protein [Oscillatoria sp. CS-180]|uniref:cupin domain-containing protein n=1 Tax=Oscillatoria sp. CS-180 TaxID=3021720 RepID=UPI00232BC031|nr:cupin domain-containing protein [Oscillatoria sp. CS-180]MDB9527746.1 cupin domain-containing protein [Oscillatoria sp. CS-180]